MYCTLGGGAASQAKRVPVILLRDYGTVGLTKVTSRGVLKEKLFATGKMIRTFHLHATTNRRPIVTEPWEYLAPKYRLTVPSFSAF